MDIARWRIASKDLDQLSASLYFNLEPQRQRFRDELLGALRAVPAARIDFEQWQRVVTYQFSLSPLSAAGSLTQVGGRFNIGRDVDRAMQTPWPALYLAEDSETAFREKFGIASSDNRDGLNARELALMGNDSITKLTVHGHLEQVFDFDIADCLDAFCAVLRKMKTPSDVPALQRRLGLDRRLHGLIRSAGQLRKEVLVRNWRGAPVQFGLPSPSQILAGMIRDAGFEAIRYPSSKGSAHCLAVFPDKLVSDQSFVALSHAPPPSVDHPRLDLSTSDALCGWAMSRG